MNSIVNSILGSIALLAILTKPALAQDEKRAAGKEGGSNIGGTNNHDPKLLMEWCNGSTGILQQNLAFARIKVVQKTDYAGANKDLRTGLIKALEYETLSKVYAPNTLVYRALTRGLSMMDSLTTLKSDSVNNIKDEDIYVAIEHYYGFITSTIATLDRAFFIQYWSYLRNNPRRIDQNGVSCIDPSGLWNTDDQSLYETRFVEYAKEQLKWLNHNFAQYSDKIGATSNGPSKVYLKLAEIVALSVKEDLEDPDNIFFLKHACVIQALGYLHAAVADYNLGNKSNLMDDRVAINYVYSSFKSFNGEIVIPGYDSSGCKL